MENEEGRAEQTNREQEQEAFSIAQKKGDSKNNRGKNHGRPAKHTEREWNCRQSGEASIFPKPEQESEDSAQDRGVVRPESAGVRAELRRGQGENQGDAPNEGAALRQLPNDQIKERDRSRGNYFCRPRRDDPAAVEDVGRFVIQPITDQRDRQSEHACAGGEKIEPMTIPSPAQTIIDFGILDLPMPNQCIQIPMTPFEQAQAGRNVITTIAGERKITRRVPGQEDEKITEAPGEGLDGNSPAQVETEKRDDQKERRTRDRLAARRPIIQLLHLEARGGSVFDHERSASGSAGFENSPARRGRVGSARLKNGGGGKLFASLIPQTDGDWSIEFAAKNHAIARMLHR